MHGEVGIVPFLCLQHLRRFTISLCSRSNLAHHESCRTSGHQVSIGGAELYGGTLDTRAVPTAQRPTTELQTSTSLIETTYAPQVTLPLTCGQGTSNGHPVLCLPQEQPPQLADALHAILSCILTHEQDEIRKYALADRRRRRFHKHRP